MPIDPFHGISRETKIGRCLYHILSIANNASGSGGATVVNPGVTNTVTELIEYQATTADVTAGTKSFAITGFTPKYASAAAFDSQGDYAELGATVVVDGNNVVVTNQGVADFQLNYTIILNVTGTIN